MLEMLQALWVLAPPQRGPTNGGMSTGGEKVDRFPIFREKKSNSEGQLQLGRGRRLLSILLKCECCEIVS